jgi:hypothetical protein
VVDSQILAMNNGYGYSRPCQRVLRMAKRLGEEDERGVRKYMVCIHLA